MWFDVVVLVSALAGGAVAAVTGFGIGSLLTPALALQVDTRLAVAAVSIPHIVGTAFRFWLLGGRVDRRVLWTFGLTSAAGGLAGALLQERASTPALMVLFGALLLFTAGAELTGLAERLRFRGPVASLAGAASGLLGGLVGNQGGIRSAALLGVDLPPPHRVGSLCDPTSQCWLGGPLWRTAPARQAPKHVFVATATAVGLMVDGARVPVYLWRLHDQIRGIAGWVALATLGVVAGTLLGNRVLARIPERWFRRIVAVVLAALGGVMLVRGILDR